MSFHPDVVSTHAYSCRQCGSKATWHAERQGMVCGACRTTLDLAPLVQGPVAWFPLVERLRDAPENRRTWTPGEVTTPCPACGGPATFPANNVSTTCQGCATPIVRGAAPEDAPLAPSGVIPFAVGEENAEQLLRGWAGARDGGRLGSATVRVLEVRREYVPYWQFSAHVHCPYRGEYDRTRNGQTHRVAFGGTIDESYHAFARGFAHLPSGLLAGLEPMSLDVARPYDPRYLSGAIVEQYTCSLWDAWDVARRKIDAEIDEQLKAAGDGETLPAETWPAWSQHQGRLVLVPLHALTCTALGETWPALVHGVTGQVVASPPVTRRDKVRAVATLLIMAGVAALVLWWLVPRIVTVARALGPALIRALLS